MEERKGCFWLYKGDKRVTGIYGLFCQLTDDPKVYTLTEEQIKIVLGNLEAKVARMLGKHVLKKDSFGDLLTRLADLGDDTINFDNVRIITLGGELVSTHKIKIHDDNSVFIER